MPAGRTGASRSFAWVARCSNLALCSVSSASFSEVRSGGRDEPIAVEMARSGALSAAAATGVCSPGAKKKSPPRAAAPTRLNAAGRCQRPLRNSACGSRRFGATAPGWATSGAAACAAMTRPAGAGAAMASGATAAKGGAAGELESARGAPAKSKKGLDASAGAACGTGQAAKTGAATSAWRTGGAGGRPGARWGGPGGPAAATRCAPHAGQRRAAAPEVGAFDRSWLQCKHRAA